MANGQENLIPFRSEEEAREKGRIGGINSGKTCRERKQVAEYLQMLLSSHVVEEKLQNNMTKRGIKKNDQNYAAGVAITMLNKALTGDVNAGKLLLSLIGEMPKEESSVNMTVSEGNQVIAYVPDDGREPNGNN
jgi:hypothetical protein